MQFAHQACLDKWRWSSGQTHCRVCMQRLPFVVVSMATSIRRNVWDAVAMLIGVVAFSIAILVLGGCILGVSDLPLIVGMRMNVSSNGYQHPFHGFQRTALDLFDLREGHTYGVHWMTRSDNQTWERGSHGAAVVLSDTWIVRTANATCRLIASSPLLYQDGELRLVQEMTLSVCHVRHKHWMRVDPFNRYVPLRLLRVEFCDVSLDQCSTFSSPAERYPFWVDWFAS